MRSASTLRKAVWRAYAAMAFRVGLYQWLTRVLPSRLGPVGWLVFLGWSAILCFLGSPSIALASPSPRHLAQRGRSSR